ncbi:MAG TPA: transporter [Bacteroidales bacterium]|nr:transporter [Bacteroidales bacterium]
MILRRIIVLFYILALSVNNIAYGQCCTAGNPIGGDGSNIGADKKELRISASYKYSLSKNYFYHDIKTDLQYVDKSYFDYGSLSLTYGILSKLSANAELGYFIDKTQKLTINNESELIRAHGLGDLAFNIKYIPFRTVKPISQLVISAGIKIPVGAFNEQINGVTIPISLQPSSGSLKYNASAFYMRKRPDRRFGWNTFALFEISQTIKKGYLIYRYGNYFQFAFAGTCAITKKFDFIANAKFEFRGRDKRENNLKIESTGSYVLYINPQLIYDFKYKWGLFAMADIPLYKYVNGCQLTNTFSVQVGLRKSFSLCKSNS